MLRNALRFIPGTLACIRKMAVQGFSTYNQFKLNIKELKQLYDITYHLYLQEHERIKELLPTSRPVETVTTQVGIVNHGLNSLFQKTQKKYPDKLRQLILVSSITTLEVFLVDLIQEISKRDTTPFNEQAPVEFTKGQVLNSPSIADLKKEIISRDLRKLTSGGFTEIRKYYQKKFQIDFNNLNVPIKQLEEIHTRRHLHVHRNGVCDKEYVNKYPKMGYTVGSKILITHDYLKESLEKLSEFAQAVNKAVLTKYPDYNTGFTHYNKKIPINSKVVQQKLMLELRIRSKSFDIESYLKSLTHKSHKLEDYIAQISVKDRLCIAIIVGEPPIITKFFTTLKSKTEFELVNVIELKI